MGRATVAFRERLGVGQAGESVIARWLQRRHHTVLPVYEKILDTGKGPQLFLPAGSLIAPDMLVYKGGRVQWVEAKHKAAFTWHRLTQRWVTGIDLRHYKDYCKVMECGPWPVWLLFLHRGGQAKDSPAVSPSGLFGNALSYLMQHENHRSENWGSGGMVYWSIDSLIKMAELTEVE